MVAQQAVVHKHAVQAVAQHLVHQGGGHCAVHASRQGADGMVLWANLWKLNAKEVTSCEGEQEEFGRRAVGVIL